MKEYQIIIISIVGSLVGIFIFVVSLLWIFPFIAYQIDSSTKWYCEKNGLVAVFKKSNARVGNFYWECDLLTPTK